MVTPFVIPLVTPQQPTARNMLRPIAIIFFLLYYDIMMIFPLKDLIDYDENMYEITTATARRAFQLSSVLEKDEKDDWEGKMVALAARQVFTQEVQFRIEAE